MITKQKLKRKLKKEIAPCVQAILTQWKEEDGKAFKGLGVNRLTLIILCMIGCLVEHGFIKLGDEND